ncbi:hypothetical protein Plhal304r1_c007g0028221 [Plasmopara halstedii]
MKETNSRSFMIATRSAKIRRWTKELYSISTSSDTFSSIISDGYVREEDELKPHS